MPNHPRLTTLTCPEPCHRRRGELVHTVARPQLPIPVVAPAVDATSGHYGACVAVSRRDGHSAWRGEACTAQRRAT